MTNFYLVPSARIPSLSVSLHQDLLDFSMPIVDWPRREVSISKASITDGQAGPIGKDQIHALLSICWWYLSDEQKMTQRGETKTAKVICQIAGN